MTDPLKAHRRAVARAAALEAARDAEIVRRHAAGESYRVLARVAGVSFQRVAQIVQAATPAVDRVTRMPGRPHGGLLPDTVRANDKEES